MSGGGHQGFNRTYEATRENTIDQGCFLRLRLIKSHVNNAKKSSNRHPKLLKLQAICQEDGTWMHVMRDGGAMTIK